MARPIAVIDSETDPFKKGRFVRPFIWGFFDGIEFVYFDTFKDLLAYIRDRRMIVYAHNGGKFDYMFILDELEPYNEITIINGRLAKFKIGACEFRDSVNILPVALRDYEKDDFDYSLLEEEERTKPENREKIIEYLRSDCINLYALVKGFVTQYGLHLTQATAAMKKWGKIYGIKPPKTDSDFYNEYSKFYFGGRVECFQKGIIETQFSVFDINSAYPRAMLEQHAFSTDPIIYEGKPKKIVNQNFYEVFASSRGALPFRDEKGKLTFPRDDVRRIYHITGWELQAAFDTNSITIHKWIRYHEFSEHRDFSAYILEMWSGRQAAKAEGDKARDIYYKLLMNSLYGKWAANPEKYRRYLILPMDDIEVSDDPIETDTGDYYISGKLGNWLLAERKLAEDERRYYNIATGASITGFVRAYLWRALHSCGLGSVLYCDTDSIATCEHGSFITEGKELGQWKNEGDFIKAGIGGKKLYIFESATGNRKKDKKASKGARLTSEELWKVAAGETIKFTSEIPTYSTKRGEFFVERDIKIT